MKFVFIKKAFFISCLFCLLSVLTGCIDHRKNFFVEGIFSGVNSYDSSERCRLIVSKIDKDEYKLHNGYNVIEDVVKNNYFLLSFYIFNESESKQTIELINLVDAHNGSKSVPITYVDKNFVYIKPLSTDDKFSSQTAYYVIESNYELKQQHFYFSLFIEEGDILYD